MQSVALLLDESKTEEVQQIATVVQELRTQRGLSQVELARRSRIHPADISRIEGGRLVPYRPQVRRLARALGVPVEELTREFKV